jgi:hypothetical protein
MLKHGASKIVIVPKQFRGFDHEQMIAGLKPSLPDLQHVVVVGGAGVNSFEKLLSEPKWEDAPDANEILTCPPPRPGRHYAAHLYVGHDGRAERCDAFGQYHHGEHHPPNDYISEKTMSS